MSEVKLSTRRAEVAALVAKGKPDKQIAATLGISVRTVQRHVQDAAARIPGNITPRRKLLLLFYPFIDDEDIG